MRLLLSKPDALGDQLIAAGPVQELLRRQPGLRLVWHVTPTGEAVAPLIGATVFAPDWRNRPAAGEAARLAAHPGRLVLLPFPLAAHEPWSEDLRRRLRWWHDFLRATAWDVSVLGLVNRNWVGDFTAIVAPAERCIGFDPLPMRQPLVNEARELAGADAPAFTRSLAPSFERSEAAQLLDLFALVEPALSRLADVPVWSPAAPLPPRRADGAVRTVAIAPGVGGDPRRAWPLAHFVTLAREWRQRGAAVVWIEGPADASRLMELPGEEIAGRRTYGAGDLSQLAADIAAADLLFCHDTAYAHLAAGLGTPTVAIYGGGQRARFHPAARTVKVVQGLPPCAGCQWHCLFDRPVCVADLPLEAVRTAAAEVLAGRGGPVAVPIQAPLPESALVARLQGEVLQLNADRFARLQIIQSLLAPAAPAPQPHPRLSVIIPMGRPERAAGTLAALAAQRPPGFSWEIVLVGTESARVAAHHPHLPVFPVVLARREIPPMTRCLGVGSARGDWFLFIDDDVEPAPDFLIRCAAWLDAGPGLGAVGPRLPGRSRRFFGRVTDYANFWAQQDAAAGEREWLYSAALLVRAEAYRRSGGFNPDLPNGEDVDLTRRIRAAGFTLRYEPDLVAWHDHGRDTLPSLCRYFWRNGNAARYFFAHHGGACCFSIRTALSKPWSNLRMNAAFRARHGERLGALTPWVLLAYFIVEFSIEYHFQRHLAESRDYERLPARTRGDRACVRAMRHFARGEDIRGTVLYAWAMLLDLGTPVRR